MTKLIQELGSGSFGVVWLAKRQQPSLVRAIKIPHDRSLAHALLEEVEVLDQVNHQHVVRLYDVVTDGPVSAIILEYVPGTDLQKLVCSEGPLPWQRCLQIATQLLQALGAAHGAGVLHRDIKPSNVLVTNEGIVKVTDFGLAAAAERAGSMQFSLQEASAAVAGSPLFMAPELLSGLGVQNRPTVQADLYSAGAVLHFALTGRIAVGLCERPRSVVTDLPLTIDGTICSLLSSDPAKRPASALESIERLQLTEEEYSDKFGAIPEDRFEAARLTLKQELNARAFVPPETVVIVTGTSIWAERGDRLSAYALKSEIDRRGFPPHRHAVVISDIAYRREEEAQRCPCIVVGNSSANHLTEAWKHELPLSSGDLPDVRIHHSFETRDGRVLLLGETAEDIFPAARAFVAQGLLSSFLDTCWCDEGCVLPSAYAGARSLPAAHLDPRQTSDTEATPTTSNVATTVFQEEQGPASVGAKPAATARAAIDLMPVDPTSCWKRPGKRLGEEIAGPDGGLYVWVPAGKFEMGSAYDDRNENPVHLVQLTRGFWMRKHPVTKEAYARFCADAARPMPSPCKEQEGRRPVVLISWDEAQDYCTRFGVALPTEAEWEYAARGPYAPKYPWGQRWEPQRCCNRDNQGDTGTTFPVGSFPAGASWCGALDMAGNVWEWCSDWYDWYGHGEYVDPVGPKRGENRVLRGGSYKCTAETCRTTTRNYDAPATVDSAYGFRCVIRPQSPKPQ